MPERRLAAILSADVAGYSRLMARDEAATVEQLASCRAEVEAVLDRQRGRLVDFTGDNFLAEFASAQGAVRAALAIQRVLAARNLSLPPEQRMEFRMGVHLGDVRFEDGRVYGDGVNIAARIQALAEPGGLCISAAVHEQVARQLDLHCESLGERRLKNIDRPVRIHRVRIEGGSGRAGHPLARRALAALAAALLVAGGLLWLSWPRPLAWFVSPPAFPTHPAPPEGPSIAVLPFENMSGDPEQEYFSDGVSEDLITDLSKVPHLLVISRNSAFTYKGRAVNVEDVGRELGVRYVLEGSVRKAGERLRITAQLIDASTGFHLWSERYDRELADIFELQSELSREILRAMRISIRDAEIERVLTRPTHDLRAHDAFLRGFAQLWSFTRTGLYEARRHFLRATELDPGFAPAWAMLGITYSTEYAGLYASGPSLLDLAEAAGRRALELDPDTSPAHSLLAQVALFRGQPERAIGPARRAVELVPNFDPPYLTLAMAHAAQGDYALARQAIEQALRLNPRGHPVLQLLLGIANYAQGREEEAIRLWEGVRAQAPEILPARVALAAIYAQRGRAERAQELVDEVLSVNPELTAVAIARSNPSGSDLFGVENLRRAGFP